MEQNFKDKLASRRKYKMPSSTATSSSGEQISNGINEVCMSRDVNLIKLNRLRRADPSIRPPMLIVAD